MSKSTQVDDADVEALLAKLDGEAAAEATVEAVVDAPAETEKEDDRPIVINLPVREDPTQLQVAKDIPLVQPLDANGNITGVDPAIGAQVTSPAPAPDIQSINGNTTVSTPVAAPAVADQTLPEGVKEILDETGAGAWLNTDNPDKPFWFIRNGPRQGGVPFGASLDEWRGRCQSIAV